MEPSLSRLSRNLPKQNFTFHTVTLACLVAVLLYLAVRLAGALLSHPQTVWLLWPGCALLVSVLLLVPQRTWPSVIPAAFGAFVLYDVQAGVPIGSIAWFILADTVQVLIAAVFLGYLFDGVPRLKSVWALSKYAFFAVLLAPGVAAFLSAFGIPGEYWTSWRTSFLSEVLAFITLTPAILGWVSDGPVWVRKPRAYHLEFAALIAGLFILSFITFTLSESSSSPALLYSLVPFLLWAALRFGSLGVSTSVCVVAFLSIWGAVHGRGPFTIGGLFNSAFSLQLFLVFTATPFMVLAALAEERRQAEHALRKRQTELNEAQRLAQVGSWQWDPNTDITMWSEQLYRIAGRDPHLPAPSYKRQPQLYTPESWEQLRHAVEEALRAGTPFELDLELHRPDGTSRWVIVRGEAQRDATGRVVQLRGTGQDMTERKRTEEALRESEERLRLAVQAGRMYVFEWDAATDTIVRSGRCADILDWMDDPTRDTGQQFVARVHRDDREAYTATETGLTPENPTYQTSYRMPRPDGGVIWLEESGHGFFDGNGAILRTIGLVADVTERKLAEEAISNVSRRLIEAQEQERARIARELHDDLSQRMALLQIGLEQFEQQIPGLSSQVRKQLRDIAELSAEVSSTIHDLSHELHPSKLETLGLVASIRGFCREFSQQHKLAVQFVHHNVQEEIPKDVTLCLFRVVQEALQNVVKHSGAEDAKVELSGHDNQIDLCISDSGTGFGPESARAETGIGLVSMRERLRLVGGHLSIESGPSLGTRIRVQIPLSGTTRQTAAEQRQYKANA